MADVEANHDSDADLSDQMSGHGSDSDFSGFESDEAMFDARVLGVVTMNQAENDRNLPIDDQLGWEREDSPPTNAPYKTIYKTVSNVTKCILLVKTDKYISTRITNHVLLRSYTKIIINLYTIITNETSKKIKGSKDSLT